MAIPKNITKEHLLKAIEKIDKDGIPKDGASQYYDVIYNDKIYPPKVIVSYANLYSNGEILDRRLFNGGIGTPSFKLLEDNGFIIEEKILQDKLEPKIWFVTQGKTFTKEEGMRFLWAPLEGKEHTKRFYWDNLKKVKKGDIIFNYSNGIKGVSIASTDGYSAQNKKPKSPWNIEGFRVDINLVLLEPFISKERIIENKATIGKYISSIKNKPFNNEGGVNEGYLYEFTKDAGSFIRELYGKPFGNEAIDDFFDSVTITSSLPRNNNKIEFDSVTAYKDLIKTGLQLNDSFLNRFVCSLLTKPFVILTGLSGSGKTKLAQAFSKWICADTNQYRIIPVGADWTNREPLLGYPNALEKETYIMPDNGALQLLIEAEKPGNEDKPYFLILDEMNLSHVERYFADFLSAMESDEAIPLHNGSPDWKGVPSSIKLPKNLYVIGTVNIDETTYMFSPKVLDRANVIEFRVSEKEMEEYLSSSHHLNLDNLTGLGSNQAADFVKLAQDRSIQPVDVKQLNTSLLYFFAELQKTGAEFGYRSASEILRFVAIANKIDSKWEMDDIIDVTIMQKLLPKVHGSRKKLDPILKKLGEFCLTEKLSSEIKIEDLLNPKEGFIRTQSIKYPLSFEKISRMYSNLMVNGFTSYAEA